MELFQDVEVLQSNLGGKFGNGEFLIDSSEERERWISALKKWRRNHGQKDHFFIDSWIKKISLKKRRKDHDEFGEEKEEERDNVGVIPKDLDDI